MSFAGRLFSGCSDALTGLITLRLLVFGLSLFLNIDMKECFIVDGSCCDARITESAFMMRSGRGYFVLVGVQSLGNECLSNLESL